MLLLANSFALGGLAGGFLIALISSYIVRDAESWMLLVWAGYAAVGCMQAAIYAPILKVLAFGRTKVTKDDGRRAMITGGVCASAGYLIALVAHTHQYDGTLLFALPVCAALLDVARARKSGSKVINDERSETSLSAGD